MTDWTQWSDERLADELQRRTASIVINGERVYLFDDQSDLVAMRRHPNAARVITAALENVTPHD